jgi:DNA replication and repair protein RecF
MPKPFKSSIDSIEIYNFRNHNYIKLLDLSNGPIVITGANGIGKTNILEAISLLTLSKGLRSAKISELTNQENPEFIWRITAQIQSIYGLKEISTYRNIRPNAKSDSRLIHIDGQAPQKKDELGTIIKTIWVTPPMQQLFAGPSSDRRSFFDHIVTNFFFNHSSHLSKYNKYMRERLKLLKTGQNDNHWLSALEQNMFIEAQSISDARMKTLEMLNNAIEKHHTPFTKAILSLSNEPISEDFLSKQRLNRNVDAASGRTSLGPHLFDLEVIYKEKNMPARLCSTGEQKSLLINIILAQTYAIIEEFEIIPILLFDEIISHLDNRNRELLFEEILKINAQAWLSGIDPISFAYIKDKAKFIDLANITSKA